ncbi:hypothetical protein [Phycicoccus flavus]|uniref:hypothetical protein n=1 Tax=Phycicoccus flavus TaxID=2502783 RepID=UPI000FEBB1F8|nr:hypothetical protein [Phycicoccus flavus]NHA67547.1 hypothetical protein [Phycicoccus flavus]
MARGASPRGGTTRRTAVWAVVAALVGTGALVVLSVPAAFLLWTGVGVAVGRGDPTWNDGEQYWGTGTGLVLTALLALGQLSGAGALRRRTGPVLGRVLVGTSVLAVVVVHVLAAVAFVG